MSEAFEKLSNLIGASEESGVLILHLMSLSIHLALIAY